MVAVGGEGIFSSGLTMAKFPVLQPMTRHSYSHKQLIELSGSQLIQTNPKGTRAGGTAVGEKEFGMSGWGVTEGDFG